MIAEYSTRFVFRVYISVNNLINEKMLDSRSVIDS